MSRRCTAEGCEKDTRLRRFYCAMHLSRLARWGTLGNPRLIPDRIRQRLTGNVSFDSDGCWRYKHLGLNGYGYISIGNKRYLAHRVSYELFVGPIPDGLVMDHLCRQPACIRPDHLEAVTPQVNSQRGMNAVNLWLLNATKTHCVAGHPFDEANTYVTEQGWRRCRACKNRRQKEYMQRNRDRAIGVAS